MKKILLFVLLLNATVYGQLPGTFLAKEYSKEVSLYRAKAFIMSEVLGHSNDVIKFDIYPLVAAKSGELTTLVYKCDSKNKSGLLLGFNSSKFNEAGVTYQLYGFKNLSAKAANEFCDNLEIAIKIHRDYLESDNDNKNIYLNYDDIGVLIYKTSGGTQIRLFWKEFDSDWDYDSLTKTKKRLNKELNKF